ncbi:hypothetical protein AQUCO_00500305v1 [Aquilegia coerulea]|uniref:C2 domain-containing protein n=1 Tax=Aquilegia coerulea TaxID=218851 RepID=A0A2G5ERJ9_AQUCA|nr:hypothetical protein AQUCO_00500305v1 [Aquilegia coerulea]
MEKLSSSTTTSSRSLEITIISAEDLRNNGHSIKKKKNVFVTVETSPNHSRSTSMDSEGGSFPYWNKKLDVPLPYSVKHIRLDVKCLSTTIGVRIIGSVSIPVSDILEDYVSPHCLHYVSYRLTSPNGYHNGIINFSIRMMGSEYSPPMLPKMGNQQAAGNKSSYAYGSMLPSGIQASAPYESNGSTSVTGIPVSKGYGF